MKKNIIFAAVCLSLASGVQAKDGAQERVKFDLWNATSGQQQKALNTLCDNFNDSQSKFEIECTSYKKYNKTLQAAVAAYRVNQGPAIVHANEVASADLITSKVTTPYKDLMEDNGFKVNWDDYISGVKGYYSDAKGDLLAMPFNPSTVALYVNKTQLKAAGVSESPETWEETADALRKLKANGSTCPYAMKIEPWRHLEQLSAAHNSPIASNKNGFSGYGAELLFNKGIEVKHLENIKKWSNEGLMTTIGAMSGINAEQAFNTQHCSMVLMSSGRYGIVKANVKDFEWEAIKIPVYKGYERHNTIVGGGAFWTMKKQPDEVYAGVAAFYAFMNKTENQLYFSKETGYTPTRISTVKYIEENDLYNEGALGGVKIAFDTLNNYKTGDYNQGVRLGFYAQVRTEWKNQVEKFFDDQKNAQEAMDDAVKKGNKLLRRFEKTYGL